MSLEFDNNILDIVNQKGFYPYEYMPDFENFKEEWISKETFYSFLTSKKISDKKYEDFFNVSNKYEIKMMKYYHNLNFKCDT